VRAEHRFVVELEAESSSVDDSLVEVLADRLARSDVLRSAALSAGGGVRGVGTTASVGARDIGSACQRAVLAFTDLLRGVGLDHQINRVAVLTEEAADAELETEPDQLAGVSEVAALLSVSRQRVAELRQRDGFPAPVAHLAAGPIWRVATLRLFLDEWSRRPGRPRRAAAG
jgi:hypothetical protein